MIDGEGVCDVDARGFNWKRGDVICVPAGSTMTCRTAAESYLLRVSDDPLFRNLGWLRDVPL